MALRLQYSSTDLGDAGTRVQEYDDYQRLAWESESRYIRTRTLRSKGAHTARTFIPLKGFAYRDEKWYTALGDTATSSGAYYDAMGSLLLCYTMPGTDIVILHGVNSCAERGRESHIASVLLSLALLHSPSLSLSLALLHSPSLSLLLPPFLSLRLLRCNPRFHQRHKREVLCHSALLLFHPGLLPHHPVLLLLHCRPSLTRHPAGLALHHAMMRVSSASLVPHHASVQPYHDN
eukprot:1596434-Rhodomonas_salina.2